MNKPELKAKAESLGIEVDPGWTKKQIADAIADESRTASKTEPSGISNVSGQRWQVYGKELMPGDVYVPVARDLADKRATAKVDRAVAMKKLERV